MFLMTRVDIAIWGSP